MAPSSNNNKKKNKSKGGGDKGKTPTSSTTSNSNKDENNNNAGGASKLKPATAINARHILVRGKNTPPPNQTPNFSSHAYITYELS